ncbi:MAG: c-type cytochrome [Phycisphaerales bacterium JB037]
MIHTPPSTSPTTRAPSSKARLLALALAGAAVSLSSLAGCRGDRSDKPPRQFLPDMDDQPRWNPQSESEFFVDKRTMRQPPEGTVASMRIAYDPALAEDSEWGDQLRQQREDLLAADTGTYYGVADGINPDTAYQIQEASAFIDSIPVAVDAQLLERGRERFDIYCSACHGYAGEGGGVIDGKPYGGMVGQRWSYAVPSFHDAKYKDDSARTGRDGYLFYVARHGVQDPPPDGSPPGTKPGYRMPPYAHALSTRDTWAIVAYIRALQTARDATLADVPPEGREILRAQAQTNTERADRGDSTIGGNP